MMMAEVQAHDMRRLQAETQDSHSPTAELSHGPQQIGRWPRSHWEERYTLPLSWEEHGERHVDTESAERGGP